MLLEQNKPVIKKLLKDTSKPRNYGSLVKVNNITDGVYFGIATN